MENQPTCEVLGEGREAFLLQCLDLVLQAQHYYQRTRRLLLACPAQPSASAREVWEDSRKKTMQMSVSLGELKLAALSYVP